MDPDQIAQIIALTECSTSDAEFYLASSFGDVAAAVDAVFTYRETQRPMAPPPIPPHAPQQNAAPQSLPKQRNTDVIARLSKACFFGTVDDVRKVLSEDPSIINELHDNRVALYSACRRPRPNLPIVELLLTSGADVTIRSTVVRATAVHGLFQSLREFVVANPPTEQALQLIKESNQVLNLLRRFGVNVNAVNGENQSPVVEMLGLIATVKNRDIKEALMSLLIMAPCPVYGVQRNGSREKLDDNDATCILMALFENLGSLGSNDTDDEILVCLPHRGGTYPTLKPSQLSIAINGDTRCLQICAMPRTFSLDTVKWQIFVPGTDAFVDVADHISEQLKRCSPLDAKVTFHDASYEVSSDLCLRGTGPLAGAMLRWIPHIVATESAEDIDTDDDEENIIIRNSQFEQVDPLPLMNVITAAPAVRTSSVSTPLVAAPTPPSPEMVQPKQTTYLQIRTNHFDACHDYFISQLPCALGIELTADFRWDATAKKIMCRATADKLQRLKLIVSVIDGVDRRIGEVVESMRLRVVSSYNDIATRLRNNPVVLHKTDPTLGLCRQYFDVLRSQVAERITSLQSAFNGLVRESLISRFAVTILDTPLEALQTCTAELMNCERRVISEQHLDDMDLHALAIQMDKWRPANLAPGCGQRLDEHFATLKRYARDNHATYALPHILRSAAIHCQSASLSLPFYFETSNNVLEALKTNDVVVVSTSTGSGKSTLMPLMLLADPRNEFKRIAVTQPRRFAAESICDGINARHGGSIVGFAMAGHSRDLHNPIIYYTDGLLRTMLSPTTGRIPFDVVIIDEVHERSKEIDACIALLALAKREGRFMPKVILASATFDDEVLGPFKRANCSHAVVAQDPTSRFHVSEHYLGSPCSVTCSVCNLVRSSPYYIQVVSVLQRQLKGTEQLLLFLPSQGEVEDAINKLMSINIAASPLYAAQNGRKQLDIVRHGRVFVSTNIAETSLTFPNLRFVVDIGKVQRPIMTRVGQLMETVDAPLSTLRQRRGRVGRTCDGDYIGLYSNGATRNAHIVPKTQLEGFEDLLFSLYMQLKRDVELDFPLKPPENLRKITGIDPRFVQYPILGSKAMTIAFDRALKKGCSLNILCLAAMRKCFSNKLATLMINAAQRNSNIGGGGDIGIATAIMVHLANRSFVHNVQPPPPNPTPSAIERYKREKEEATRLMRNAIAGWCRQMNLDSKFETPFFRAYIDIHRMKTHCAAMGLQLSVCDLTNPAPMLECLVEAFPRSVFISTKTFMGPHNMYTRALDMGDGGDSDVDSMKTLVSFHTKSTLYKVSPCPVCVIALDFVMFGAELKEGVEPFRLGAIQLAQEIPIGNLQGLTICRRIRLRHNDEASKPGGTLVTHTVGGQPLSFRKFEGSAPDVLKAIAAFLEAITIEKSIDIKLPNGLHISDHILSQLSVLQDKRELFRPMKFLWKNSCCLEVKSIELKAQPPVLKVKGRCADVGVFSKHIAFWNKQLTSAAIVADPDLFVDSERFQRPLQLNDDARQRLHILTSGEIDHVQLWHLTSGPKATRATRMLAVSRIAIHQFKCRLVGGFIRDFVIRGDTSPLQNVPPGPQWLSECTGLTHIDPSFTFYEVAEGIIPKDLDIELSPTEYFDVNRFIAEVREQGITVDHYVHVPQRHIFCFDKDNGDTGPFTADFIEHHFAALHSAMDFDVNALCVMAPFVGLIGFKAPNCELNLPAVIDNVINKKLVVKRPRDPMVQHRIDKMTQRGWTVVLPDCVWLPVNVEQHKSSLVALPPTDDAYRKHHAAITKIGGKNIQIFFLGNGPGQKLFNAHKKIIEEENGGNANIFELYHGTGTETAVSGILQYGLDDRYWGSGGFFGKGAYHADDPALSLNYTSSTNPRTIFVCDVIMGNIEDISANPISQQMGPEFFPPRGKNSIKGRVGSRQMEWIVYRYGQSLPKYMIRFDK